MGIRPEVGMIADYFQALTVGRMTVLNHYNFGVMIEHD